MAADPRWYVGRVRTSPALVRALAVACQPDPAAGGDSAGSAAADCAPDSGPAPTWSEEGRAFFTTWCQRCHATDSPQRYGAPEGVVFDTAADVVARRADRRRSRRPGGAAVRARARIVVGPLLGLCACAEPVPCAPGFGRLDAGACVPVEEGTADAAGAGGGSGGGADTGTEAPTPAPWTPAEIEAALAAALADGLPEPAALRTAWIGAFDGAQAGCPGEGYDLSRGVEGCETQDGWRYSGQATDREELGDVRRQWRLDADGTAERPDGTEPWAGDRTDDGVQVEGAFLGTVQDTGGTGWVGQGAGLDWRWADAA